MLNRRELLQAGAAALAAPVVFRVQDDPKPTERPVVMTVDGPLAPIRLGYTLPHEHVMVDFAGAAAASPERYDAAEVERIALPHLKRVKELGCSTIVECTPAYLARDPALLKRLGAASGLNFITNTGYYAANGGKHLPAHVAVETADQLAARWLDEVNNGIGGTGIKPGFIKIGVDAGPLNDDARKIVSAACRAHKMSGLTIAAHTGDAAAAAEQLEMLVAEGLDPSAWIWVHAQNEKDSQVHIGVADLGAWVELDGVTPETIDQNADLIDKIRQAKFLNRLLVSHDAGWYHVGEPNGGTFRPYVAIYQLLVPALKKRGFSAAEITMLLADNPARALTIQRRLADDGFPKDQAR